MKTKPRPPSSADSVLTRALLLGAAALVGLAAPPAPRASAQVFADQVVSYAAGVGVGSYTDPAAALGKPGGNIGGGTLNPFSPNFATTELARVGFGGQITLRLANYVVVDRTPGVRELGVWENVGLQNSGGAGPGQAGNPATVFGQDSAVVSVSADGASFFALNGGQPILFNLPGNFYANATGLNDPPPVSPVLANFGQPFTGSLADFNGQSFAAVLGTLNGSAGGSWLDLDASGLTQVGYVRFDGLAVGDTLEINGVSINDALVGAAVPEPGALTLLLLGAGLLGCASRFRRGRPTTLAAKCAAGSLGLLALLGGGNARAQTFTFPEIKNWTGSGSNQAAMVVDWNDGKNPESIVWGYRWDGPATGLQMILAIDAADPRFAISTVYGGSFVFSIGYDLNNNGGAFTPGSPGMETGSASDPADHYAEGVFTKFWGYDIGVGNPYNGGSWTTPETFGAADRDLTDGSWDGWSLSFDEDNFTVPNPGFPTAADPVPEPSGVLLALLGGMTFVGFTFWKRRGGPGSAPGRA